MPKLKKTSEGYPDPVKRPHSLSSWGGSVMKVLQGVEKAAEKLAKREAHGSPACSLSLSRQYSLHEKTSA